MPYVPRCSSYQDSKAVSLHPLVGYCDLDGALTGCHGDIHVCEKLDLMTVYLPAGRAETDQENFYEKRKI